MNLTPKDIRKLIEDFTGLDISVRTRKRPYVNAKAIYARVCSDHLRFIATIDEVAEEIGLTHGDICYYANSDFSQRLKSDVFAELWIEIDSQVKEAKKALKAFEPIIEIEQEGDVINELIKERVRFKRFKELVTSEGWIRDIVEMPKEQQDHLYERIRPAIIRTKKDFEDGRN